MPFPEYRTTGYPLDPKRAERFVVDFEDLIIEPEERKPKKPVKGRKEA